MTRVARDLSTRVPHGITRATRGIRGRAPRELTRVARGVRRRVTPEAIRATREAAREVTRGATRRVRRGARPDAARPALDCLLARVNRLVALPVPGDARDRPTKAVHAAPARAAVPTAREYTDFPQSAARADTTEADTAPPDTARSTAAAPGDEPSNTAALYASLTARGANRLATETLSLAVPLLVYQITGSMAWSGLVMLLEWLPRLTGIPAAGPLVDRYGSRRCLVAAETLRIAFLGAALVGTLVAPGAWGLLVAATMAAGALGQASFVAVEKLGVEIGGSRPITWTQSVQAGIDHGTLVVAPLVAGLLATLGAPAAMTAVLALAVLCRILCHRIPRPTNTAVEYVSSTPWRQLTRGLRLVRRNKTLVHLTVATAAFNLLVAVITAVTPAIVREEHGAGSLHVSVIWAAGGGLSLVFIAIVTRVAPRVGMVRVGRVSAALAAPAIGAAAWAPGFAAYLVLIAGFLALDGAFACFLRTLRARVIPLPDFGVTVSAMVLLVLLPFPFAGLLVAAVPYAGVRSLLTLTAAVALAVMLHGIHRIAALTPDERAPAGPPVAEMAAPATT
ncbi:MFS transporter [Yinghuangia sp. ASG 101]|uniref:MFS transporter n=1 Tax=Yinghuangia sp. ASG 101 TaxID=2896848 RepID=UPI001E5C09D8|nr:MFS transporter [Yinghuangia sp. ASG 101]UGQ13340.1 MFS transporter [Yinghuangia sp. ASG 101]